MPKKITLLELLKQDTEIQFLASIGDGRHLFEAPISRLATHKDVLKKARGDDPNNVDLLRSSFGQSGGEPLYPPVMYPERQSDGSVKLWIVDGHQRIRAELANGKDRMIVQVMTIWRSLNEAFEAGISANFARYRVDEDDVFSILTTNRVGKDRIIELTGYSASKVERLIVISEQPDLVPLVREGLVGPSVMAKLIRACNKNPDKLQALTTAMTEKRKYAIEKSKEWKNRIRTNKHIKYEKRDKDKRDPKTHFKSVDWDEWDDALKDDLEGNDRIVKEDGRFVLRPDTGGKAKYVNIRVGDEAEWETCIALFGLSGTPRDKIDPDQLRAQILDHWDEIGDKLRKIYADLAPEDAKKKKGRGRGSSTTSRTRKKAPLAKPAEPKPQSTELKIVSSDSEKDD